MMYVANVTVELIRKKAEHHDGELAPLQEIALHQEGIEKIELIQQLCPKLQILLLQSNLIAKIENLNKLKELKYLNLALNNIEKIENLEKCESLNKLDLTLNFIGHLTSVANLRNNYNLQLLFLHGNPCTDYIGYREYVIATLPQLESLDGEEIKRSERIIAFQNVNSLLDGIMKQQEEYAKKRHDQKIRMQRRLNTLDVDDDDEESVKRFWNEKCEHSPEIRVEIEKRNQAKNNSKNQEVVKPNKVNRTFFSVDGRPYNINDLKLNFHFDDGNLNYYTLELQIYRYLDTSLISIDLQPFYVRVCIKNKIFQICLPEEINLAKSSAKRSLTTGYLLLTLIKLKCTNDKIYEEICQTIIPQDDKKIPETKISENHNYKREFLEIGSSQNVLDFSKMTKDSNNLENNKVGKLMMFPEEKLPPPDFEDDIQVPPLL